MKPRLPPAPMTEADRMVFAFICCNARPWMTLELWCKYEDADARDADIMYLAGLAPLATHVEPSHGVAGVSVIAWPGWVLVRPRRSALINCL